MQTGSRAQNTEAILAITVGMLALHLIFGPRVFLYIAVVVGAAGLLSPFLASKIAWLWLKLAQGLGWINSRILLTLVFYLFLTPLALLNRLFKKNMLQLRKTPGQSYFVTRNHSFSKKDFEHPW